MDLSRLEPGQIVDGFRLDAPLNPGDYDCSRAQAACGVALSCSCRDIHLAWHETPLSLSSGERSRVSRQRASEWLMQQFMTIEKVQAILREEVKRAGGLSALAREIGTNHTDLSNCLSGRRLPTKKVLDVLHLRKVTMYERI